MDATATSIPTQPHTELPPVAVRDTTPASANTPGTEPAASAPATATPPVALQHAAMHGQKAQLLLQQMLTRGMANQMATATVLPLQFDADTWNELVSMQLAVADRLSQQQRDWAQGVTEIVRDYSRLRLANTLSKFIEQEYNLGAQLGALMTSQVSQFVNLLENVQVDYGYWIAQKQPRSG